MPVTAAQARVQTLLDRLVAEGIEDAVQAAVWVDGELVVDAWAAPAGMAIDGDTLIPIWSSTKGIAATAVHRLVERGVLAWDDPIARWWPEFAAAGKAAITLRQALSHTAGLAAMPPGGAMADICGWEAMCRGLAAMPPATLPGAVRAYHAITYGWLIGETARRADGRDFARIVDEECCRPLGIASPFWRGQAPVLDLDVPPAPTAGGDAAVPLWVLPLEALINRDDVRRACVPASNGIASARSLARHYAALVGDGVDGVRLLSPATVAAATAWQVPSGPEGRAASRYGLGYALMGPDAEPGSVFGHGGHGGSLGLADARLRLGFGFTRRRMHAHPTADLVLAEIRAAIAG